MYTHKTKCMYKCIQAIYTYIYIQNIYAQNHKTNLKCTSIFKYSYRKETHER